MSPSVMRGFFMCAVSTVGNNTNKGGEKSISVMRPYQASSHQTPGSNHRAGFPASGRDSRNSSSNRQTGLFLERNPASGPDRVDRSAGPVSHACRRPASASGLSRRPGFLHQPAAPFAPLFARSAVGWRSLPAVLGRTGHGLAQAASAASALSPTAA